MAGKRIVLVQGKPGFHMQRIDVQIVVEHRHLTNPDLEQAGSHPFLHLA